MRLGGRYSTLESESGMIMYFGFVVFVFIFCVVLIVSCYLLLSYVCVFVKLFLVNLLINSRMCLDTLWMRFWMRFGCLRTSEVKSEGRVN